MKAKAEITKQTTARASEIQHNGQSTAAATPSPKEITLETLRELKAKMYAQADAAIRASDPRNPEKIMRIQRRVDRDAAHIAFAINAVTFKM